LAVNNCAPATTAATPPRRGAGWPAPCGARRAGSVTYLWSRTCGHVPVVTSFWFTAPRRCDEEGVSRPAERVGRATHLARFCTAAPLATPPLRCHVRGRRAVGAVRLGLAVVPSTAIPHALATGRASPCCDGVVFEHGFDTPGSVGANGRRRFPAIGIAETED